MRPVSGRFLYLLLGVVSRGKAALLPLHLNGVYRAAVVLALFVVGTMRWKDVCGEKNGKRVVVTMHRVQRCGRR